MAMGRPAAMLFSWPSTSARIGGGLTLVGMAIIVLGPRPL
jgi:hypothetical protein